jgi:uncharacterized membrane protein YoaT (DUF817 family)
MNNDGLVKTLAQVFTYTAVGSYIIGYFLNIENEMVYLPAIVLGSISIGLYVNVYLNKLKQRRNVTHA